MPQELKKFTLIQYVILLITFVLTLKDLRSMNQEEFLITIFVLGILYGLILLNIYLIKKKKNWARIIWLILFIITILPDIPELLETLRQRVMTPNSLATLAITALDIYCIILLFSVDVNKWFKQNVREPGSKVLTKNVDIDNINSQIKITKKKITTETKNIWTGFIVILFTLLLVIIVFLILNNKNIDISDDSPTESSFTTMPDLEYHSLDDASNILSKNGLHLGKIVYRNEFMSSNLVLEQSINNGSEVQKGSSVDVVVSQGGEIMTQVDIDEAIRNGILGIWEIKYGNGIKEYMKIEYKDNNFIGYESYDTINWNYYDYSHRLISVKERNINITRSRSGPSLYEWYGLLNEDRNVFSGELIISSWDGSGNNSIPFIEKFSSWTATKVSD